jgi:hypothetical protein
MAPPRGRKKKAAPTALDETAQNAMLELQEKGRQIIAEAELECEYEFVLSY